ADSNSLVLDAGGYHGDWTAEILVRFGCRSLVFEPVPDHADFIAGRFRRNSRVTVVAAALGNSDRQLTLHLLGDSSSAYRTGGSALAAPMKDVARVFDEWKIEDLACAKINNEGGEYDL